MRKKLAQIWRTMQQDFQGAVEFRIPTIQDEHAQDFHKGVCAGMTHYWVKCRLSGASGEQDFLREVGVSPNAEGNAIGAMHGAALFMGLQQQLHEHNTAILSILDTITTAAELKSSARYQTQVSRLGLFLGGGRVPLRPVEIGSLKRFGDFLIQCSRVVNGPGIYVCVIEGKHCLALIHEDTEIRFFDANSGEWRLRNPAHLVPFLQTYVTDLYGHKYDDLPVHVWHIAAWSH